MPLHSRTVDGTAPMWIATLGLVSCLPANRREVLSRDGRWPVRRAMSGDRANSHFPQALA